MSEPVSTRNYLLYAIGEILLVMIGILLALQINNWNEWRKDRILEKVVLEDIKDNIDRNNELIKEAIEIIDQINSSSEILDGFIQKKSPYSDTLGYHISQALRSGTFLFKLNFDGYESLKSTGFTIIQTEELKDEILGLFEVTYGHLLTNLHLANSFYLDNLSWWKEFFYQTDTQKMIPYHKDEFLDDKRFLTEFNESFFMRRMFQAELGESLIHSQKVLQLIKDNLDK